MKVIAYLLVGTGAILVQFWAVFHNDTWLFWLALPVPLLASLIVIRDATGGKRH